jgi:hypothetical protein
MQIVLYFFLSDSYLFESPHCRCRGLLFLFIKNNTHKGQTCMSPAGFEQVIPGAHWLYTHILNNAATWFA